MANPQKENGHTSIANEIIEAMAKTYFSSYEIQIIFAIFRKTYGWQKKEDWITNTQLAEMTEIPKSHVSRTIKKLLARNIIAKNNKKIYFQKDYEKWQKLPIQVTNKAKSCKSRDSKEKLPKQVTNEGEKKLPKQVTELPKQVTKNTQTGNKKLPKQVPTKEKKETITKETITKEKGPVFKKTLSQFKKMRSKNKKKMTDYAVELLVKKLDRMTDSESEQIAIMNQSIENCWMGVYELKNKNKQIKSIKQLAEEDDFDWRKE
ncbi:MAG: replication protein [Bacteriovoracia bacterium]